jgi:hypothetical protein
MFQLEPDGIKSDNAAVASGQRGDHHDGTGRGLDDSAVTTGRRGQR